MAEWGTPHLQKDSSGNFINPGGYLNPLNYDIGASEFIWGKDNPNVGASTNQSSLGLASTNPSFNQSQINSVYKAVPGVTSQKTGGGGNVGQQGGGQPSGGQPPGGEQPNLGDGGYGAYLDSLMAQTEGLNSQRQSQEQIAQNTYNQGMNTLNSQLTSGKADLEANQQKTLRDLAQNMRQSWQQGNSMLGSRGASDSSAANQYAYALTKFGNQQRGDVQAQYQNQLSKLQSTYDTESKNLELAKNTQLQQIAQWFAEAQNALKGTIGQAKLQQGQQAYNTALQLMDRVNQEVSSRRAALDQWALNRATSYGEAAKAMGVMGSTQAATPQFTNLFGNVGTQQNTGAATGYNYTGNEKYDPYTGQRIQ